MTDSRVANTVTDYQAMVTSASVAMLRLDADKRICYLNPKAESILGEDALHRDWGVVIKNIFAEHRVFDTYQELLLYPDTIYMLELNAIDGSGQNGSQLVQLLDITEARRQVKMSAEAQSQEDSVIFSGNLAHQIRTPLSSALLNLKGATNPDNPRRVAQAELMRKKLKHLDSLVGSMLSLKKGITTEQCYPMTLESLRNSFTLQVSGLMMGEDAVHIDPMCGPLSVAVEQTLIITAIQNLVDNARESASPQEQDDDVVAVDIQIRIGLSGSNNVDIVVSDSGSGIAEADLDKIFNAFYTDKPKGMGLGLSIVKEIARAHGGSVWVKSVVNMGSDFGIRLPLMIENTPQ